jgi:hypothetical protein
MDEGQGGMANVMKGGPLRPGDVVELRSAAEILATLDEKASLEGMPFMPEMLKHAGKRLTVSRRVEKICNNVDPTCGPIRRMRSTVHLEDLRCDGSAHDGCQLSCRLYWREEWLRRVDDGANGASNDSEAVARLDGLTLEATRTTRERDGSQVEAYRCQATEAIAASAAPLDKYDVRQFIREKRAGNVPLAHLISVIVRTLWAKALRVVRLRRMLPVSLPASDVSPEIPPVGLQKGDLVQIRSKEEIAATLNRLGRNRGLSFAPEMVRYCGGTYRVRDRVEKLIDERTGAMIEPKRDCVILDGVTCPGEDGAFAFLFCPRGTFPFWREAWLRRVKEADAPAGTMENSRPPALRSGSSAESALE